MCAHAKWAIMSTTNGKYGDYVSERTAASADRNVCDGCMHAPSRVNGCKRKVNAPEPGGVVCNWVTAFGIKIILKIRISCNGRVGVQTTTQFNYQESRAFRSFISFHIVFLFSFSSACAALPYFRFTQNAMPEECTN